MADNSIENITRSLNVKQELIDISFSEESSNVSENLMEVKEESYEVEFFPQSSSESEDWGTNSFC